MEAVREAGTAGEERLQEEGCCAVEVRAGAEGATGSAGSADEARHVGAVRARMGWLRRSLLPVALWYGRHEWPRAWELLSRWGMTDHWRWAEASPPTVVEMRGRFHGHRMRVDLRDYFQRIAWFFGCYHERHVVSALTALLREGDVVVDGGANTGLLALHAAGMVGRGGRVEAFEPCEAVLRDLRWHVEANGLGAVVRVHAVGLSDREETLELRVPGAGNLGAGTLGPLPARYGGEFHDACTVKTVRLEDVLGASEDRPLLIKLDVEGFELRALRGAMETIVRRRPAILAEVNDEMLGMNGTSPQEMDGLLRGLGYRAFALDRLGWRKRYRLDLHPLTAEQLSAELDALWLHPEGPHWGRVAGMMREAGTYWRYAGR